MVNLFVLIDTKAPMENLLGKEKSPYLLQHKDNPVHWYPWGEAAFKAARAENKPIFLSVGYSTCYWCHVMEKESFEDSEIAALLNDNFISIKVDREERPDVDQLYMDYVQAFTGRGGWPMSVFLTTDLKPFWGGTFLYKKDFASILKVIANAWRTKRDQVSAAADDAEDSMRQAEEKEVMSHPPKEEDAAALDRFFVQSEKLFDGVNGGFGGAPKFPPAMQCSLLLRIERLLKDPEDKKAARSMACYTLEKMARGGIFDQIGFGFHRYSTDEAWLVPHFEKMLYDNALLISTYTDAWLASGSRFFGDIAEKTANFILKDMLAPEKGFYCAIDAGRPGHEGDFYLWNWNELRRELSPDELDMAARALGCSSDGNFEGASCILVSTLNQASEDESERFSALREKLRALRARRAFPHIDKKIITSWNALTISALAKAYQAFGRREYLVAAIQCLSFIREWLFDGSRLKRHYFQGAADVPGFLDDYSYLIAACLDLWECDFSEERLTLALELQRIQDELLLDEKSGAYYYAEANELPVRRMETSDNALPAGNSVSCLNLMRFDALFPGQKFGRGAENILAAFRQRFLQYPMAFPMLLHAAYLKHKGVTEISVVGAHDQAEKEILKTVYGRFLPERVLMFKETGEEKPLPTRSLGDKALEGKTTVYVCKGRTCLPPMQEREELSRILDE